MFTITKEFSFEASHQLTGLPEGHPCMRLHGHSYRVVVELQSNTLNEHGFVLDYRALDEFKRVIDEHLDHHHLNDIKGIQVGFCWFDFPKQPTAENLAKFLYEVAKRGFPQVVAVRVSETAKTWAEYKP